MGAEDTSNATPWWWAHLVVGFFALTAIVLGSLDHFLAKDAWGVGTNLLLIASGLTAGGVTIGHAIALPQNPPN